MIGLVHLYGIIPEIAIAEVKGHLVSGIPSELAVKTVVRRFRVQLHVGDPDGQVVVRVHARKLPLAARAQEQDGGQERHNISIGHLFHIYVFMMRDYSCMDRTGSWLYK